MEQKTIILSEVTQDPEMQILSYMWILLLNCRYVIQFKLLLVLLLVREREDHPRNGKHSTVL